MTVEIDLKTAYNRVRWDFINSSIQAAGILDFLRKVIMSAISPSTMQVLWNGVPTEKFNARKTNIFLSKGVSNNLSMELSRLLSF